MGAERTAMKHRAIQHRHALERLRERYWPDAEQCDLIAIRNSARAAAKKAGALAGTDVKKVFVPYRGRLVAVLYAPRHDAVRTVLPCGPSVPVDPAK